MEKEATFQDVVCPKCGEIIAFDDYADLVDAEADPCAGKYVELVVYHCDKCHNDFTARIISNLKFVRVEQ